MGHDHEVEKLAIANKSALCDKLLATFDRKRKIDFQDYKWQNICFALNERISPNLAVFVEKKKRKEKK